MNNGKICIPVTGATADEMIANINLAAEVADLIELRVDSLEPDEIEPLFRKLKPVDHQKPFLITFRPKEQGGCRDLTIHERQSFWANGNDDFWGGDFEEDVVEESMIWPGENIICSYHDFEEVPGNIEQIYERLKGVKNFSRASIFKLAVQPADIADSIPLWKLLKKARNENVPFVPVAMGEAGKWTRILGPAFGAPLTYASLEDGGGNAPGQISAKDLIDVYRVKELSSKTRVYAIIGDPVSASLSPFMHNAAYPETGIDAVFLHMEVRDLDRFVREFIPQAGLNFGGFAVTMPHKETIIPYLDEIDETARKIGAVNTVKFKGGRLYGYNTDAYGFIEPLKARYGNLTGARVGILGAGGAARACVYALQQENAVVTIFARNPAKAAPLAEEFGIDVRALPAGDLENIDVLVNTTPLGMKPGQENFTLLKAENLANVKLVYDLITKPAETGLVKEAKKAGITTIGGIEMLVTQGIKQFEIWTGRDAPAEAMRSAAIERL